jgi:hypothetical protein
MEEMVSAMNPMVNTWRFLEKKPLIISPPLKTYTPLERGRPFLFIMGLSPRRWL